MLHNKTQKLKEDLEDASKKGILIYKGNRLSTPEEIACVQWVNENETYLPEFIVKNEIGEVKEIWYGESTNFLLTD